MVEALRRRDHDATTQVRPVVDIVIPVLNEAPSLAASVERLGAYLDGHFPFAWTITIADNGSTDGTWAIASALADRRAGVRAIHLDEAGRGRALRRAWSESESEVVAYMDVDISTDLDALLPLVAPLLSGHSDVAVGSRLAPGAEVARGPKREAISRAYNLMLRTMFATQVRDMQCGFKALRRDVAVALLPAVEDEGWFFDTELLLLAERNGLRIHQVPVDWKDDPDSRVHLARTAPTTCAARCASHVASRAAVVASTCRGFGASSTTTSVDVSSPSGSSAFSARSSRSPSSCSHATRSARWPPTPWRSAPPSSRTPGSTRGTATAPSDRAGEE